MDNVADGRSDGALGALELARRLYRRMPVAPVALSVDGIDALVQGPLDLGVAVGELVVVELESGERWAAQLRDLAIVEREAGDIDLAADDELGAIRVRPLRRTLRGQAAILGRFDAGGFREASGPVFSESPLRRATAEETRAVLDPPGPDDLDLGDVLGQPGVVAPLAAKGFSRHTFLCGQSGSGKTYTTGVLLEELLDATDLPIVALDPNSDYVRIGELADGVSGPDAERYAWRARDVAAVRGRGADGDGELLAAHVSDLPLMVQAGMAELDPIDQLDEYAMLRRLSERLATPYSAADLAAAAEEGGSDVGRRLAERLRNLGVPDWGLWCRAGEPTLTHSGLIAHRAAIVDLGSLATRREAALASLVVLQNLWDRRHERRSRLIVVDEAHNLFPTEAHDAIGRSLLELGVRIAGEGRKFGLHLLLCTQRPAKLHANVLSQCDNLVMLRVNSRTDVEELIQVFSHVPEGMIRRAPSLRQGEVLVAGPIAPIPRFVRTRRRLSAEAGADVPTDWATAAPPARPPIAAA